MPLKLYASQYLGLACHALGDYRRASEALRTIVQSPPAGVANGAIGGMVVGSWEAFQSMSLAWLARCLAERGEFAAPWKQAAARSLLPKSSAAPTASPGPISAWATACSCREISMPRACARARLRDFRRGEHHVAASPGYRMLGAAPLAAGRVDEGASLVRAAADEVESGRLLMQQAAVLAMLAEACFAAGRWTMQRRRGTARAEPRGERAQRGDEATALHVLGDVDDAEHDYLAAIDLARELEMRPLLARSHLGIASLYLRTGERERAGTHLHSALQLFAANDVPVWLRQAEAALGERGRGREFAGGFSGHPRGDSATGSGTSRLCPCWA